MAPHDKGAGALRRRATYTARIWHRDYFPVHHIGRFIRAQLRRLVGTGTRVLDVGCGDQPFRDEIASLGGRYVGIDVDAPAGTPDGRVLGTVVAMPVRDASFDVVVCSEVLEHVWETADAFSELQRVTRPGGRILITVPFIYPLHEAPRDFVRLTPYAIERLAALHGLEVERLERAGHESQAMAVLLDRWLVRTQLPDASTPRRALAVAVRTAANVMALAASRLARRGEAVAFTNTCVVLRRPHP